MINKWYVFQNKLLCVIQHVTVLKICKTHLKINDIKGIENITNTKTAAMKAVMMITGINAQADLFHPSCLNFLYALK